jgi:hypothetical protein
MTYDPTIGRWTTEDPIGFRAADANLYRYVGNDPTNRTDPSGLFAVENLDGPLPVKSLEQAQKIANQGVAVDPKETDAAGPDVTDWYAYDLIMHLKHRFENPIIDDFIDQAKDMMSHKWINFGTPTSGKGLNTVVVRGMVLHKKQLGNMAFTVVGTVLPPEGKSPAGRRGGVRTINGKKRSKNMPNGTASIAPRRSLWPDILQPPAITKTACSGTSKMIACTARTTLRPSA